MREILFRGKTRSNFSEWIYGSLDASLQNPKNLIFIKTHDLECDFNSRAVIPETVGQYTGLDDIKKVKIFEHDIVQIIHPCWSATCFVKFINGAFFFVEIDNPVQNAQIRADMFMKNQWQIKVVGNIHNGKVNI